MSLAELPPNLTDPTPQPLLARVAEGDALAQLLRDIRVDRCLQYCFEPHGDWMVDASPAPFRPPGSVSFHIVVEGQVWIDMRERQFTAEAGDVVIFPRGTRHFIGAGTDGRLLSPGDDLPPPPWPSLPRLVYALPQARRHRLLCGFLQARVLDFQPLMAALPEVMLARPSADDPDWLGPAVRRLVREIDEPTPGGLTLVARLSEIVFIELLRRQMLQARASAAGWLAALGDPVLQRALHALHAEPEQGWSQQTLARAIGVSKTVLCEHFQRVLAMSPMRYLREWRLYLASAELADSGLSLQRVAERAGYGTEAAFNRAFARQYGTPPATWRRRTQASGAERTA